MADQELRNFNAMEANLQNTSSEQPSITTDPKRIESDPALDTEDDLLQVIQSMFARLDQRLDEFQARVVSNHCNWSARAHNNLANHPMAHLCPLRTPQNKDIANFPPNKAAIEGLDENELNVLLSAYDLSTAGDIVQRKLRFIRHIGIYTKAA
ncbi:hypothetical protein B9Z19DRAFT_1129851 [Tuber borchii]|uniref:Uncharacterized protein n=1 Tax=Tuber borchii TaxID=42251 RepID=A0A2T6ZLF9_TUBBO|nr:hypothetical protein B9Z19DRAFT_1129851 [Tuber borchii]